MNIEGKEALHDNKFLRELLTGLDKGVVGTLNELSEIAVLLTKRVKVCFDVLLHQIYLKDSMMTLSAWINGWNDSLQAIMLYINRAPRQPLLKTLDEEQIESAMNLIREFASLFKKLTAYEKQLSLTEKDQILNNLRRDGFHYKSAWSAIVGLIIASSKEASVLLIATQVYWEELNFEKVGLPRLLMLIFCCTYPIKPSKNSMLVIKNWDSKEVLIQALGDAIQSAIKEIKTISQLFSLKK